MLEIEVKTKRAAIENLMVIDLNDKNLDGVKESFIMKSKSWLKVSSCLGLYRTSQACGWLAQEIQLQTLPT